MIPIFYPMPIPIGGDEKLPLGASIAIVVVFVAVIAFLIWAIIDCRK